MVPQLRHIPQRRRLPAAEKRQAHTLRIMRRENRRVAIRANREAHAMTCENCRELQRKLRQAKAARDEFKRAMLRAVAREDKAHQIAQAALRDATRYRWLRWGRMELPDGGANLTPPALDAACDFATGDKKTPVERKTEPNVAISELTY